jgi:hypothetical protein
MKGWDEMFIPRFLRYSFIFIIYFLKKKSLPNEKFELKSKT